MPKRASVFWGKGVVFGQASLPYAARMSPTDSLLDNVRAALAHRGGDLRSIAQACGMSYDTVLRIRHGEGDPGFSKVDTLARYLGVWGPRRAVRCAQC